MKKHKDLIAVLRAKNLKITPLRRYLLQFFFDNQKKQSSLKQIHDYIQEKTTHFDRSSVYRNLEVLKNLDIIQELDLPKAGKRFQYIFDRKVHHFYICKSCGQLNRGNKTLFARIDDALKEVHGFEKANLSVVFYGLCLACSSKSTK